MRRICAIKESKWKRRPLGESSTSESSYTCRSDLIIVLRVRVELTFNVKGQVLGSRRDEGLLDNRMVSTGEGKTEV